MNWSGRFDHLRGESAGLRSWQQQWQLQGQSRQSADNSTLLESMKRLRARSEQKRQAATGQPRAHDLAKGVLRKMLGSTLNRGNA